MSRITRESFIDQFQSAGGLDAAALGADASAALEKAGIATADLHALAGADGKIDTHAELGRLFDLLDRVDHDGHYRSIETRTSGSNTPTVSGDAYDALAKDLATARSKAPAQLTPGGKLRSDTMPSSAEVGSSLSNIEATGFSDVHLTPVRYRNQGRDEFSTHPYPTSPPQPGAARSIRSAGCAPCSLAMADSALRGAPTRPEATADFAVQQGLSGRPGSGGTETGPLTRAWAAHQGWEFTQTTDADVLATKVRKGGVAVVSVGVDPSRGAGHFADRSHVVVVNGVATKDGEEWFAVADPGRANQSQHKDGHLSVDKDVIQIPRALNGCGQVWISKSQLEKEMHRSFILERGPRS